MVLNFNNNNKKKKLKNTKNKIKRLEIKKKFSSQIRCAIK